MKAEISAQELPTFHTGVSLVHVDAEVVGEDGRPLSGATKEDFRILDNGKEQSIVTFSEGEQPLDLILLFDISGSMKRQIRKVAAVAHRGLQELKPGDAVSVMVFTAFARTVAPFSKDRKDIEQAVKRVLRLEFRGSTRIVNSVGDATSQFLQLQDDSGQRRRAMLVTTDNMGIPSLDKESIIENLWAADVLVEGLIVKNNIPDRDPPLDGTIDELVEKTGGDMIHSNDLEKAFPETMHRIRSRYTLYYRLPEDQVGSLRTIDVQLSDRGREHYPGAHIIARRGRLSFSEIQTERGRAQ